MLYEFLKFVENVLTFSSLTSFCGVPHRQTRNKPPFFYLYYLLLLPYFDFCSSNRRKSNKSELTQTQPTVHPLIKNPCLQDSNRTEQVPQRKFCLKTEIRGVIACRPIPQIGCLNLFPQGPRLRSALRILLSTRVMETLVSEKLIGTERKLILKRRVKNDFFNVLVLRLFSIIFSTSGITYFCNIEILIDSWFISIKFSPLP